MTSRVYVQAALRHAQTPARQILDVFINGSELLCTTINMILLMPLNNVLAILSLSTFIKRTVMKAVEQASLLPIIVKQINEYTIHYRIY
jgi:hypothetical protein